MNLRGAAAASAVLSLWGCAAAPRPQVTAPASKPLAPEVVAIERKAGWILRLEQQRVLRDPAAGADLTTLAIDPDPGVRRRALLAIGRVGLPEASPIVVAALSNAAEDEQVRATAAFALGLLADPAGIPALEAALIDPSAVVRGRAAQGLGLAGRTGLRARHR